MDKEPYGDVEYADPGYQSDKKKRYPIDTEEHARAAWSYINKHENASQYSSEDLAKVKARIKRAAKKHGIEISEDESDSKAREGGFPYGCGRFDSEGYCQVHPDHGKHVTEFHHEDLTTKELGMKAHHHRLRGENRKADRTEAEIELRKAGAHVGAGSGDSGNGAIECRTAVELSGLVNNEITFLPAGIHSITPVGGGIGKPINILIDHNSASEMENQRALLCSKGKTPFFDFNHEDGASSFWPSRFFWRAGEGVVCQGAWSESGKEAVKGRDFRAFSPVFYVDNKLGNPARVVCRETARPNMGGLVNDPAFSNLPLWAKNDGKSVAAGATSANIGETMNDTEVAALRAKNQELENKIDALAALVEANQEDANTQGELKAARAEREMNLTKIKLAESEAVISRQQDEIRTAREGKVDAAIRAAIGRGAVLPRDLEQQRSLKASAMADEGFIRVIDKMVGRSELSTRVVGDQSRYSVQSEDPEKILCKLATLAGQQSKASMAEKKLLSLEFAAIYARELRGTNANRILGYPLTSVGDALKAGDNTDANLGVLSGTLVTQRVLELLKFTFPALTSFTSDFSDQPAQFNQTILTRIVTVPTVQTYSTASGWTDSGAVTTDVPVTINQHKGVPITFNANILASTVRRLFDEFAEAQSYALGKDMVDNLYANLTDANFTNNTVSTSASFTRSVCVDVENALNKRGVPFNGRTLLLWPDAFAALEKDSTLVTFAAFQRPDIIEVGTNERSKFVIPVASFTVVNAPNLPSNNANLVGFGGSKSALVIAVRPDNDYTSILPGASYGNVSMVTDPDIGLTVTQVQYVNHQLSTATSRISYMYGTAAGQGNAGQLLKANSGSGSSH